MRARTAGNSNYYCRPGKAGGSPVDFRPSLASRPRKTLSAAEFGEIWGDGAYSELPGFAFDRRKSLRFRA
jgi:hypothetical protein